MEIILYFNTTHIYSFRGIRENKVSEFKKPVLMLKGAVAMAMDNGYIFN